MPDPAHGVPLTPSQVKALGLSGGDARAFLAKALQPPTAEALDAAAAALTHVGALSGGDEEVLTPLGQHLARMPLEPRVGKVNGAARRCVATFLDRPY